MKSFNPQTWTRRIVLPANRCENISFQNTIFFLRKKKKKLRHASSDNLHFKEGKLFETPDWKVVISNIRQIILPISHNYRKCPFWWFPSVDVSSQKTSQSRRVCSIMDAWYNTHQAPSLNRSKYTAAPPLPPSLNRKHHSVSQDAKKAVRTHLRQSDTLWDINCLTSLPSKACVSSISLFLCCLVFCATMLFDVISFHLLNFGKISETIKATKRRAQSKWAVWDEEREESTAFKLVEQILERNQ